MVSYNFFIRIILYKNDKYFSNNSFLLLLFIDYLRNLPEAPSHIFKYTNIEIYESTVWNIMHYNGRGLFQGRSKKFRVVGSWWVSKEIPSWMGKFLKLPFLHWVWGLSVIWMWGSSENIEKKYNNGWIKISDAQSSVAPLNIRPYIPMKFKRAKKNKECTPVGIFIQGLAIRPCFFGLTLWKRFNIKLN